jgi:hypothetical protein
LIHSASGSIPSISGGLVGIAFPAGWIIHRKRHPVALRVHPVARLVGAFLGLLLAVVLRGPIMVILLTLDYGSTGAVSVVIRSAEAVALHWLGRRLAARRFHQLSAPMTVAPGRRS